VAAGPPNAVAWVELVMGFFFAVERKGDAHLRA